MNDTPTFVLVCGCARSGTSVFADLLRSHGQILMGRERYAVRFRRGQPLTPELFARERFCHRLEEGDSNHATLEPYYEDGFQRFDEFTHVGDKIPKLYERYTAVARDLPRARFVFLLRNVFDVAQSFELRAERTRQIGGVWPAERGAEAAIEEWNRSLSATQQALSSLPILVVEYETLFQRSDSLERICAFLSLAPTPPLREFFASARERGRALEHERVTRLRSEQKRDIGRNARFDLYRALLERAEQP